MKCTSRGRLIHFVSSSRDRSKARECLGGKNGQCVRPLSVLLAASIAELLRNSNLIMSVDTITVHEQWALRDDPVAANALLTTWCTQRTAYTREYYRNQLRWLPRLNRPISEPPMFDYEEFVERCVPSDIQLQKLFPGDPVKKTMHRDFCTERSLLEDYWQWCQVMIESEPGRSSFYKALFDEVMLDYTTVDREFSDTMGALPTEGLGVWEYWHLDRDGGTEKMRESMEKGEDIFWQYKDAGVDEYGHLAPAGYFRARRKMRLMEWEFCMLDGVKGGTKKLRRLLEADVDVFGEEDEGHCAELKRLYAHLIPEGWKPIEDYQDWCERNEVPMTYTRADQTSGEKPQDDEGDVLAQLEAFMEERYLYYLESSTGEPVIPPHTLNPSSPTFRSTSVPASESETRESISCVSSTHSTKTPLNPTHSARARRHFPLLLNSKDKTHSNLRSLINQNHALLGLRLSASSHQQETEEIPRPIAGLETVD